MVLDEKSSTCNQKQTCFGSGNRCPKTYWCFRGEMFFTETERILALLNALSATFLVMDVTRSGDGTFDMRMNTVKEVKKQKPEVKIALLCDNVSDETIAYKIKRAKEEEIIDAFFYESVPSDYLADVLDSL